MLILCILRIFDYACSKEFLINLLLETLGKREGWSERMGSFRFTEHLGKMHRFPVFSEVEDCLLLHHLPSQSFLAGVAHNHCKRARIAYISLLFLWGCMNVFWHCGGVELKSWSSCLSLHLWVLVQCVIWKSGSQDFSFKET